VSDKNPYLIIGGSTKCGTTSVFSYFQFHPQVCPCVMKESRYFLEKDYLISAGRQTEPAPQSFGELFLNCGENSIRTEATPDYLYSSFAANSISEELENVKLIFILRDPVDRMISWYKFASLNGMIPRGTSFDDYVAMQILQPTSSTPQYLRAMEQGNYSGYLNRYLQIFGKSNVHICFYEDLKNDPREFCEQIAVFAEIDPSYFSSYQFQIFNKSVPVKSVSLHQLFRKLKRTIRPATRLFPGRIREKLKFAGQKAENLYINANRQSEESDLIISKTSGTILRNYYGNEAKQITELTGKIPNWSYLN
jgi:hypothetical protein